jgi:recombination protein RecA
MAVLKRKSVVESQVVTSNEKTLEQQIEEETKQPLEKVRVEFISSNLTLLNLALSGKGRTGGWARGRIVNVIGDGSSGKTLLALELALQALSKIKIIQSEIYPPVKKLFVVCNNVEGVMDFPLEAMYGKKFVKEIEWIQTPTIEEFGRDYARRVIALKPGECLIYILDSFDALTSESGMKRFETAAKKDQTEDGAYGTEKAKYGSSSFFNNICGITQGKDATLFIVSQVRANIGVTFGKKYTRSGGKALDFYTHQCCWLAEIEKLKRTVLGEKRPYGIRVRAKIERNKTALPFREAEFTILFDYGADNVGSNLSWLYGPDVKTLKWDEVNYKREDLIEHIENNNLENELEDAVEQKWLRIEEEVKPNRKKKILLNDE